MALDLPIPAGLELPKLKKSEVDELRTAAVTKGKILQKAFTVLGTGFILAFFLLVFYYNYLMVAPYLLPILMALLVAMPLAYIRDSFLYSIESAEKTLGVDNRPILTTLACTFIPIVSVGIGVGTILYVPKVFGALIFPLIALSFFVVALAWKNNREFLVTVAVILFLLVIILFPMFFLLKNCFEESMQATDSIVTFIKTNEDLQTLMKDHRNSSLFKQAVAYAESWGWDPSTLDLEKLQQQALDTIKSLGDHVNVFFGSTLAIVSNIGSIIVGFIVFATTLFTIVLYKRQIWTELAELSPLANEEQSKLLASLGTSISRILLCTALVGITQFMFTWLSFYLAGLQLKYIMAALASFLAIIPLSGTYLIWLPASGICFARGNYIGLGFVMGGHLVAGHTAGVIMSFLPGNPHYVGMSIALGLSTFGPLGVILGPLLAGLIVTLAEIYKGFYSRKQGHEDSLHVRSKTTY